MDCFFPTSITLWPVCKDGGPWGEWKKQGAVNYSTNQENKVGKMFPISLGYWIELQSTPWSQVVCT